VAIERVALTQFLFSKELFVWPREWLAQSVMMSVTLTV